jgi:hypothetical protein
MIVARSAALALLLAAPAAQAGVTILTSSPHGDTTIYLQGDQARIETPARGQRGGVVIIDAASKKLITVNDGEHSYMELNEADRQRLKQQVSAMREQLKERLQSLPPDQRKKAEQSLGSLGDQPADEKPPASTFEPMGGKKVINGIPCQTYRRYESGKLREELCVAPWSAATVQKRDFDAIQTFAKSFMDDLGGARRTPHLIGAMDLYPGLPISRVPIDDKGQRGEEEQVKSIKRGTIAADRFAPPAGYKKKEMPFVRK